MATRRHKRRKVNLAECSGRQLAPRVAPASGGSGRASRAARGRGEAAFRERRIGNRQRGEARIQQLLEVRGQGVVVLFRARAQVDGELAGVGHHVVPQAALDLGDVGLLGAQQRVRGEVHGGDVGGVTKTAIGHHPRATPGRQAADQNPAR